MIFLPFKQYNSNFGTIMFLYYEALTNDCFFVDEQGYIVILPEGTILEENYTQLN